MIDISFAELCAEFCTVTIEDDVGIVIIRSRKGIGIKIGLNGVSAPNAGLASGSVSDGHPVERHSLVCRIPTFANFSVKATGRNATNAKSALSVGYVLSSNHKDRIRKADWVVVRACTLCVTPLNDETAGQLGIAVARLERLVNG